MKAKLIILFLLLCSSGTYAQESLRGLTAIYVFADSLLPDIEADGLNRESIQTDVEEQLRLAGIRVLTIEELKPDSPYLYIYVHSLKRAGTYSVTMEVKLNQYVFLARDPKIQLVATTWETGGTGNVGIDNVVQIRDSLKEFVDEFISAFLYVNPQK